MTMKGIEELHPRYQELMRERYLASSENHKKQMISILRQLPPPDELTKKWILKFLDRPSKRDGKKLAADTIAQYLTKIQVVAKWLGRPELVEGIKKPRTRKLTRADILEMGEIRRVLQFAPDSRTRALIHLITETGLRIDEALSIHVEDITADGTKQKIIDALHDREQIMGRMWKIEIKRSKTFLRSVYAYDSTPTLHAWLLDHPVKKGPLFVATDRRTRVEGRLVYKEIVYGTAFGDITKAFVNAGYRDDREVSDLKKMKNWRKLLNAGKEVRPKTRDDKALLNRLLEKKYTVKQINELIAEQMAKTKIPRRRLHMFRHASGTQMAKDKVHPEMMNRAMGWTTGSHAPNRYIHLIDEDLEEEMRLRYGLIEKDGKKEPGVHSWHCPICGNMNPPTTGICLNCPPKPEPMEDELQRMREEIEMLKTQRSEDLGKLALELIEKIKEKEKAQG